MPTGSFVTDHQRHSLWEHVKLMEVGEYGLPEFQRTFVWDEDKVRNLWDSLYRAFPIGQIMLWEPDGQQFPMRALGRQQVDLGQHSRYAVIDGQQRLTALWLVLTGELPLRFNLEREQFFVSQVPTENSIPLNLLQSLQADAVAEEEHPADSSNSSEAKRNRATEAAEEEEMFFHCATGEQHRKYGAALRRLNSRVTLQTLPSQVIKHAEYARVVEVFRRLNVQGVALSESQVSLAVISTKWPGIFRRIYATLRRLNEEMGFDRLDDQDFLIRAWTAVHTNQHMVKHLAPDFRDSQRSRYAALATGEEYEKSWSKLERGLNGLTLIMRDRLDLTNFQFVKAQFPLIVLINFYAHRAEVSPEEQNLLEKWLVLAFITSRYSVRALTKLREDIRATGPDKKLVDLFSHRYEPLDPRICRVDLAVLKEETFRSAYATLLYILLRRNGAEDWFSPGIRAGDPGVPSWHFHHIFPDENFNEERGRLAGCLEVAEQAGGENDVERIKKEMDALERRIVNIANLTFITPSTNTSIGSRRPTDYLGSILRQPNGKELLEKHLIPTNPQLWLHERFEQFCEERRRLIADAAERLLGT